MVILWLPTRFRGVLAPWFGFLKGAQGKMVILWLPTRFRGVPTPGSGPSEGAKRLFFGSPLGSGESWCRVPGSRREQERKMVLLWFPTRFREVLAPGFRLRPGPVAPPPPPTPPSSMLHCVKVDSYFI